MTARRRLPVKPASQPIRAGAELFRALQRAQTAREKKAALSAILQAHQALAFAYAKRWQCDAIDLEELRQEAVVWLLDAAGRYDPARGAFTSFALWRMRHGLTEYVKRKSAAVYVPGNVLRDEFKLRQRFDVLQVKLRRRPTVAELAKSLKWTGRRVENVMYVVEGIDVTALAPVETPSESWGTTWASDRDVDSDGI